MPVRLPAVMSPPKVTEPPVTLTLALTEPVEVEIEGADHDAAAIVESNRVAADVQEVVSNGIQSYILVRQVDARGADLDRAATEVYGVVAGAAGGPIVVIGVADVHLFRRKGFPG